MSLASDALALGVSTLINPVIMGERVTFRGTLFDAHVDRMAGDGTEPGGKIQTSTRETASVEFASDVTEPTPGEIITSSAGHYYRIERVQFLGFCWKCTCTVKR